MCCQTYMQALKRVWCAGIWHKHHQTSSSSSKMLSICQTTATATALPMQEVTLSAAQSRNQQTMIHS
jgi:hypothetical protein